MQTTGITRVRFGKVVTPKKSQTTDISKATIARNLLVKLDKAIANDARVLQKMKLRGILSIRLERLIEDLFRDIITVKKSFPSSGNRIPKVFKLKVESLSTTVDFFESQCQLELNGHIKFKVRIWRTLKCLIDDIKHFVMQFNMNYFSVESEFGTTEEILPPSQNHIPYRKTDRKRKDVFYAFLASYKDSDGKIIKFPRYKTIQQLMAQAGHKFPERTYTEYKSQIKKGTFDHFVQ